MSAQTRKLRPSETDVLLSVTKLVQETARELEPRSPIFLCCVLPFAACTRGLPSPSLIRWTPGERQAGTACVYCKLRAVSLHRYDYRVLTEQHNLLKMMSKNGPGLLFTKQLNCVPLLFLPLPLFSKKRKKEIEKMKGCQHWIITWAPGVGGFSVPAEFPPLLAFLNFSLS